MTNLLKLNVIVLDKGNQKSLKKCLTSIKEQTYKNIAVTIVTESELTKNLKVEGLKDVQVIYAKSVKSYLNSLVSMLETSQDFAYCLLINSTDSLSLDYCRKAICKMEENGADVCFVDTIFKKSKKTNWERLSLEDIANSDICLDNKEMFARFVQGHSFNVLYQTIYNKIISKRVLQKILEKAKNFSKLETTVAEELLFSFLLYAYSEKTVNCHNVYYELEYTGNPPFMQNKISQKAQTECSSVFEFINAELIATKYNDLYEDFYAFEKLYQGLNGNKEISSHRLQAQFVDFGKEYFEYEKIIRAIADNKTKVVSFDIFDTLLLRKCFVPKDVFSMLAFDFANEISNAPFTFFNLLRMDSEERARKKASHCEVNLDQIYAEFEQYGFDKGLIEKIKNRELEIEADMLQKRQTGFDLYQIALSFGKRVVYTSDMYLSEDFIKQMLSKSGYSVDNKLFLSNVFKVNKSGGKLFSVVLDNLKISASQMVHIGDNYRSDYSKPKDKGIKAFHLPNVREMFEKFLFSEMFPNKLNTIDVTKMADMLGSHFMLATVANELFDFPFVHKISHFQSSPKFIGYYAVGMHLFALTEWIYQNSKEKDTIHFAARDGYLPMEAYKIYSQNIQDAPKSHYLYMSRKSLFPLGLLEYKDLISVVNTVNIWKNNIVDMLQYLPKNCVDTIALEKFGEKEIKRTFADYADFCSIMPVLGECIKFDELNKYQEKIKKYLGKIIKPNDILFDVGYSGRSECIIGNLLGYKINTLYEHYYNDDLGFIKATYQFENKCFYDYKPRKTGEIREFFYMKNAPSFLSYKIDGDKVELVFEEKNTLNENGKILLDLIQKSALKFMQDMTNNFGKYKICSIYSNEFASMPYESYINRSEILDQRVLSNILFENSIMAENKDLLSSWLVQTDERPYLYSKTNKIVNFLLPPNSRRRKFAVKTVNFLAPKGSKRRAVLKKLLHK